MNILAAFKQVKAFVLDVDGVLTDGTLQVVPGGHMVRSMHVKDGYALQLAIKEGYHVLVISGGNAPEVKERLLKLGVDNVYMQAEDKVSLVRQYMEQHALSKEQVLFMGDDIPDYDAMRLVGLPCCPSDAAWDVKKICRYVSGLPGGRGCVREVIEKVMKLQGHWVLDTHIKAQ